MQLTLRQVLSQAATALHAGGIEHPQLEAELLLAYVLNTSRSYLHAWPDACPTEPQYARFMDCVTRRCSYEPLAYITGKREFWSLSLEVNAATLIPRPESELLVEAALSIGDRLQTPVRLADLGTGSGAIALALAQERPDWSISAVENSAEALNVARHNAARLNLQVIHFYHGFWCDPLQDQGYDIIVSNPPYISELEWPDYADELRHEPYTALVAGPDGLDAIRVICGSAGRCLMAGGFLLIEHGFRQAASVQGIFLSEGYSNVHSLRDLSGHERVTVGCLLR